MKSTIIAALIILNVGPAFAGRESGGSDPKRARAETIKKFINEDLKTELLSYLDTYTDSSLQDQTATAIFDDMLRRGLKKDINQSKYDTEQDGCFEKTTPKGASAIMDDQGGPICFDPAFLANEAVSRGELVALAFHEHSHHFGFDENSAVHLESIISAKYKENSLSDSSWACDAICTVQLKALGYRFKTLHVIASGGSLEEAFVSMGHKCDQFQESLGQQVMPGAKATLAQSNYSSNPRSPYYGWVATIKNSCAKNGAEK